MSRSPVHPVREARGVARGIVVTDLGRQAAARIRRGLDVPLPEPGYVLTDLGRRALAEAWLFGTVPDPGESLRDRGILSNEARMEAAEERRALAG